MSSITSASESLSAPRLLEQVGERNRFKHHGIRTERAYVDWIKRFARHFGKRHLRKRGGAADRAKSQRRQDGEAL